MELAGRPFSVMLLRRKNVWYSVRDGNWNDPNTWISNALDKKNVTVPRPGDDVYINHTVTLNVTASVNNIYIQGILNYDSNGNVLTVNGDMQANGAVNMGAASFLYLLGVNNYINTFTASTGTVIYTGIYSQPILPLSYYNLVFGGYGVKYLTANLNVGNNLDARVGTFQAALSNYAGTAYLECGIYNLTVTGATNINYVNPYTQAATLRISKTGSGALLFIGKVTFGNGFVNWSGNPTIEFRGGTMFLGLPIAGASLGTGQVKFTTNNQNIDGGNWTLTTSILISGAITVTSMDGNTLNVPSGIYIQGDNASSTFKNGDATLNMYDLTSPLPMSNTTGVFNYNNTGSILGFFQAGDYNLPFTSFASLTIGGSGKKFLTGDTTLSANFLVTSPTSSPSECSIECGSYNFTVNGTSSINGNPGIRIRKSGPGTILLVGYFTIGNGTVSLPGNPTVELRGGCKFLNTGLNADASANWGTTGIKFSTNNQSLDFADSFSAPIIISGAITVTAATNNITTATFSGVINGDNANSIWLNNINTTYTNATAPMVTGKLYCNQAANTWIYGALGNQDITPPSDPTPGYKNLTLNGSGAKRLLGNVSVKGTYTLTGPATLNSNGFSLTNP
jgi:hypothetical protein